MALGGKAAARTGAGGGGRAPSRRGRSAHFLVTCFHYAEEARVRILLVKPDISDFSVGFASLARTAPLELLMVAASAPDHECRIIDMRLEKDAAFEDALLDFRPDVVGLTAYSAEAEATKALARRAKQVLPSVPVVWGGYHATMALDDVLEEPSVDFVVRGEGETTFPELIQAIAGGGPCDGVAGIAFRKGEDMVLTPPRP